MTKTTEAKWRSLILAQERSGLTARDFAESRGIAPTTMYWWRSRLGRRRAAPELVPVEIVEHDVTVERRGPRSPHFELQIDDAMMLRIPAGFDADELRRIVQSLRC